MDTIIARTERVWAHHGPELGSALQSQSLVALLAAGAMLIVATELLSFTWKARFALGDKASLGVAFWSWFLFLPVLVLAVRLTSGEEWLALLGNPYPLVASYAIFGLDAAPGGTFTAPDRDTLQAALATSLSARAFQQLWPALAIVALAGVALHRQYQQGWTKPLVAPVAMMALFLFAPLVFDGAAWSAWKGDGQAFLERHITPSPQDRNEGTSP